MMKTPIAAIDPVAIALDQIELGASTRFSGVDLETGARLSVVIDRQEHSRACCEAIIYEARGLVLVLSIESVTAAG